MMLMMVMMMMTMYMMVVIMMVVVVVMMMMTFIDVSVLHSLGELKIPSGTKRCGGGSYQVDFSELWPLNKGFFCKSPFNIRHLSNIISSLYDNFIPQTLVLFRRWQALHWILCNKTFLNPGTPTNPPAQPTPSEFMKLFVMRHINIIFLFCWW